MTRHVTKLFILLFLLAPSSKLAQAPTTYYIDFVGGNDSNTGLSKAQAWKHAPGMTGQAGNPASKCNTRATCRWGGSSFIFKGGVTWDGSNWPWVLWIGGASTSNTFYIGVDPAWYTGAKWTRPIFDFEGSTATSLCRGVLKLDRVGFLKIDNIEFKGLYWDETCFGRLTAVSRSGTAQTGTQTYNNVPQFSTSGVGAGATFNITRSGGVYTAATVVEDGYGYSRSPVDTILIKGSSLGGTDGIHDLTLRVTGTDGLKGQVHYIAINDIGDVEIKNVYMHDWSHAPSMTAIRWTGTSARSATFNNVPQFSTSGRGVNARFNVTASGGTYTVAIADNGTGYAPGDTITIRGTSLGGLHPTHNLTITVTAGTTEMCALVAGSSQYLGTDYPSVHDSVFDGSDSGDFGTGRTSCTAIWQSPPVVYRNYFAYVTNGQITGGKTISFHDNTCFEVGNNFSSDHDQCYESNGDQGVLVYNNLAQNMNAGLDFFIAPVAGTTAYFFNNVIADTEDNNNQVDVGYSAGGRSGGTTYVLNNTVEGGRDGKNPNSRLINCSSSVVPNLQGCIFGNFHMITANTSVACPASNPPCTQTTNLQQSQAAANSNGYSYRTKLPFQPTSASGATLGRGTNYTALCVTVPDLCYTSSVGVEYDNVNHVIVGLKTTPAPRPTSGAWNIGAY